MGLGHTAVAAMSAEAVKTPWGPYITNCQALDEGNMHTLLHFGTPEQSAAPARNSVRFGSDLRG